MINKLVIQSVINKYHLGTTETVKWVIKDKQLTIDFMSPQKDVIGKLTCGNFDMEDSELAIFNTKKLSNLVGICNGELLLETEGVNTFLTKLKIQDLNFNLTYALADPLLIRKVGSVNSPPEWDVELNLEPEELKNLLKAKSALADIDNMLITTSRNEHDQEVCGFVFGDEEGHNNKITYQILGKITKEDIKLPFNSDIFKYILNANKDAEKANLYLSEKGLMRLEFTEGDIQCEYNLVRKQANSF